RYATAASARCADSRPSYNVPSIVAESPPMGAGSGVRRHADRTRSFECVRIAWASGIRSHDLGVQKFGERHVTTVGIAETNTTRCAAYGGMAVAAGARGGCTIRATADAGAQRARPSGVTTR